MYLPSADHSNGVLLYGVFRSNSSSPVPPDPYLIQIENITVPVGGKYNLFSIGRPDWKIILRGIERKPRAVAGLYINDPDITRIAIPFEDGELLSVRRQFRTLITSGSCW